jgi:DNA-directed RNA polymerase delta subunit
MQRGNGTYSLRKNAQNVRPTEYYIDRDHSKQQKHYHRIQQDCRYVQVSQNQWKLSWFDARDIRRGTWND